MADKPRCPVPRSLLIMTIILGVNNTPTSSMSDGGVIAIVHVKGVATLLEMFGFFTLIMSIVHLAIGVHQADTQQQSRKFLTFMRVMVGLTTILYSAYFVYKRWSWTLRSSEYYNSAPRLGFEIIYLIVTAFLIISTLTTTVWASVRYRRDRRQAYKADTHHSTRGM